LRILKTIIVLYHFPAPGVVITACACSAVSIWKVR